MTVRNQIGRPVLPKGAEKRSLLIEATKKLLTGRTLTRLTTADIARAAGTSAPNFYLYFAGVNEAVLAAVEGVAMDTPEIRALLESDWPVADLQRCAETFVALYLQHWHAHSSLLRARTLMVTEGDPRFIAAELAASMNVLVALTRKIEQFSGDDVDAAPVHPASAAAAVMAMLERLAAYGPSASSPLGITPVRAIVAGATMLRLLLTSNGSRG
jgi:AcrR family transcriptional regulator